jgi:hypothetical protein
MASVTFGAIKRPSLALPSQATTLAIEPGPTRPFHDRIYFLGCFLVHNEKEEFMQTVRLGQIFFFVARFLMLWKDEKRGAELNVMETLVWYGAIPRSP